MRRTAFGLAIFMIGAAAATGAESGFLAREWTDIKSDYRNFYSTRDLLELGAGLGVGGIMANTSIDDSLQDWYQDHVRSSGTDDMSKVAKAFGSGFVTVPLLGCVSLLEVWSKESEACGTVSQWGQRSLRAMLVGGPPLLVLQGLTGASRPSDDKDESDWHPCQDSHGVSGHAFMGAVPFLVAGRMANDPALRYVCYAASTLCGLSRINDDQHFPSQALLGWWIGWLSADAVSGTDRQAQRVHFTAIAQPDFAGAGLRLDF